MHISDEREFTLKHVHQNLRGYQLATGDVDRTLLSQARATSGEDVSRVYAALLTGAEGAPASEGDQTSSTRKRKRRRRRRRGESQREENAKALSDSNFHLRRKDSLQETSEECGASTAEQKASGTLGLVAAYSSSESDSNEEDTSAKKLLIPSFIQGMFEQADAGLPRDTKQDTRDKRVPSFTDDTKLGYFGADELLSSDEEVEDDTTTVRTGSPRSESPVGDIKVTKKWIKEKAQWKFGDSILSTYTCWKCSNVGHLAEDCMVAVKEGGGRGSAERARIPKSLQSLYSACREVKSRKGQMCADCGGLSNLACCLDCKLVLCDGKGHLASHLRAHPTHTTLFSFKLGRLLKCCKSTCEAVNVYELLICSHCLGKAFSQHYSMITAVWSAAGLRKIPNALCCEEHFQWHRMNCSDVCEEAFLTQEKLRTNSHSRGLLSEFYF